MPPTCSICHREDRATIDEALVRGAPLRDVARQFGVSKDAARRHKAHVSPALAAVVEERAKDGPRSALARLEELHDRAERVLSMAETQGQAGLSLQAIRELRGLVEIIAKVTGELDERPQVQVLNMHTSSEWVQLRGAVLSALEPFPEAAQAVAARLVSLESGPRELSA